MDEAAADAGARLGSGTRPRAKFAVARRNTGRDEAARKKPPRRNTSVQSHEDISLWYAMRRSNAFGRARTAGTWAAWRLPGTIPVSLRFKRQAYFPGLLLSWASFTCSSASHEWKETPSPAPRFRALFSAVPHVPSAMSVRGLMIRSGPHFLGERSGCAWRETRSSPRRLHSLSSVFHNARVGRVEANHRLHR